jgi:hypothetical protein
MGTYSYVLIRRNGGFRFEGLRSLRAALMVEAVVADVGEEYVILKVRDGRIERAIGHRHGERWQNIGVVS